MPSIQTNSANPPRSAPAFENYYVFAADMARYDEDEEAFHAYHCVVANAQNAEDAVELASAALEDGCVPLVACTAAELREMADELDARKLAPGRAYNLSLRMTDKEVARMRG